MAHALSRVPLYFDNLMEVKCRPVPLCRLTRYPTICPPSHVTGVPALDSGGSATRREESREGCFLDPSWTKVGWPVTKGVRLCSETLLGWLVGEKGFETSDPLIPKKGLGRRTECFQSLALVLQPSHSCSITAFWGECKSSNGGPKPRVQTIPELDRRSSKANQLSDHFSLAEDYRPTL